LLHRASKLLSISISIASRSTYDILAINVTSNVFYRSKRTANN
jgi:hypothetical protein